MLKRTDAARRARRTLDDGNAESARRLLPLLSGKARSYDERLVGDFYSSRRPKMLR